jgi:hypothetical protein
MQAAPGGTADEVKKPLRKGANPENKKRAGKGKLIRRT